MTRCLATFKVTELVLLDPFIVQNSARARIVPTLCSLPGYVPVDVTASTNFDETTITACLCIREAI